MKKLLAKLILRKSGGVSKSKVGAAIQFGAESAAVLALQAYVKARWGWDIPAELIAALLTALGGKFINKIGIRDAMVDSGEAVPGELLEVQEGQALREALSEDRVREIVRDAVAHRELGGL